MLMNGPENDSANWVTMSSELGRGRQEDNPCDNQEHAADRVPIVLSK